MIDHRLFVSGKINLRPPTSYLLAFSASEGLPASISGEIKFALLHGAFATPSSQAFCT